MLPTELVYLLVAIAVGALLYRYFNGHGGRRISKAELGDLPPGGTSSVNGHEIRWSAADESSFAAAWPLADGHWVMMRVLFDADDDADPEAADQGRLELRIDERELVSDATWTDQIGDRTLRADVEAILKALAHEAKVARSDAARATIARRVGQEHDHHD